MDALVGMLANLLGSSELPGRSLTEDERPHLPGSSELPGRLSPASGWQMVKFGDVVRLNTDRIADPAAASIERYVGLEHIEPEDLRIRRWGLVAEGITFTNCFKPGQTLFGKRRAYQRKVAVADFSGVCSGDIYVFEPKDPAILLPELLPFICQTERFYQHAVGTSAGSLSPRTNWTQLAQYEFPLPPLAEQRRIAAVLWAVEETLNNLYNAQKKAISLWRSISMTEFGNNKQASFEKLEKHYSIVGGQVDPKEDYFANLPLIAPNHIEGGTGRLLNLETAKDQNAISGKYFFEAGAVLYSKIRPNLVKATIAPCKGLCSADMYPLLPEPTIRKEYLLEVLLSEQFTQFAVSGSMRTGMPKLNREHLSRYECKVPPLAEQDKYLEYSSNIRLARDTIGSQIDELKELKRAILREMESGQNDS
jgi:type I restriction enzyme S subunit